jgi:hypothetical protein
MLPAGASGSKSPGANGVRDHRETARIGANEPADADNGPEPGALAEPRRGGLRTSLQLPAARRLALSRLLLAYQALRSWLHAQTSFKVEFSAIELDPPPPPWIKSGRVGLLERVRSQSGQPETFSLLDLDMEELKRAFALHSPWVKRVTRIERSPAGGKRSAVRVSLDYREPVAAAQPLAKNLRPIVVDEDGAVLPAEDLDLAAAGRLIVILALAPDRYWGGPDASEELLEPDPRVLRAARLAGFLKRHQNRKSALTGALPAWSIVAIDPTYLPGLVAQTHDSTQVVWGEPPGAEDPGSPTAEQKWNFLSDWYERGSPPQVKWPDFLVFTRRGVQVRRGNPAQAAPATSREGA